MNESIKQKILNGHLAINRLGQKCKIILSTENQHLVNVVGTADTYWVDREFLHHLVTSDKELIGLWADNEKFDFEKAINGSPIAPMCDITEKRYLIGKARGCYNDKSFVVQIPKENDEDKFVVNRIEDLQERYVMWKEIEDETKTVTLTLPCPLKEPKAGMYYLSGTNIQKSGFCDNTLFSHDFLNAGFYFSTKEDAQAWLDALKNSRK